MHTLSGALVCLMLCAYDNGIHIMCETPVGCMVHEQIFPAAVFTVGVINILSNYSSISIPYYYVGMLMFSWLQCFCVTIASYMVELILNGKCYRANI